MASVQYLFSATSSFSVELRTKQCFLSKFWLHRERCAIVLQTAWRKYREKRWYQLIRKSLVVFQKYIRGWLVRRRRAELVQNHVQDMVDLKRKQNAIKIQSLWKGYSTRKLLTLQGINPLQNRLERLRIIEASTKMQELLKERFNEAKINEEKLLADNDKEAVMFILFKCHHLLRTAQVRGIYSCNCCSQLTIIEQLMKQLPFKEYMNELRKKYAQEYGLPKPPHSYLFKNQKFRKWEDLCRMRDKSADLKEDPILKLYIDFHDKRFNLSSKLPKAKYEREVGCVGKFKNTEPFQRQFDANKNVSSKDFLLGGNLDLKDKSLPYYIDFWESNICHSHNISYEN